MFGAVKFDSLWVKAPVHICISSSWRLLETLQGFLRSVSSSRGFTTRQINESLWFQSQAGFLCVYERVCLFNRRSSSSALFFFFFLSFKKVFVQLPGVQHFHSWILLVVYDSFKLWFHLWHEQTCSPPSHRPDFLQLCHIAGITWSFLSERDVSHILFTPWAFVPCVSNFIPQLFLDKN